MSFTRGLKRLCSKVNIKYKSPHKLRNGHGVYGIKNVNSIEEFKAFSQNMMHGSMEITDRMYGRLANDNVKSIISNMKSGKTNQKKEDLFQEFSEFIEWRNSK